jgi:hypothetical protein
MQHRVKKMKFKILQNLVTHQFINQPQTNMHEMKLSVQPS